MLIEKKTNFWFKEISFWFKGNQFFDQRNQFLVLKIKFFRTENISLKSLIFGFKNQKSESLIRLLKLGILVKINVSQTI